MGVIDCDQHLFETPGLWRDHIDPALRDRALDLVEDEHGHVHLTFGDRRIGVGYQQVPGDPDAMGRYVRALDEGRRPERSYDEATPPAYWDPAARVGELDRMGIDAAMLFPNYGLLWERTLADEPVAQLANMAAWNRWCASVASGAPERLHPVAHLSLRDLHWLESQLTFLSSSGVRVGMIAPAVVEGKRLSHPDLDRAWSLFVDHGVSPVFHVSDFPRPFDDAWYEGDPDAGNPVLSSVFLGTAPALALADLAVHGVFERHPDLRVGVIELSAVWVPLFLLTLDGGFEFHARFNGAPLTELARRPSEYVRDQVKVAAFAYEQPDRLIRQAGDMFLFCSDYPHSEGTAEPLADYARCCPGAPSPADAPGLYGDNAAWLLRAG